MSNPIRKFAVLSLALGTALALSACDVDQTEEGDMPDVTVEEGNLPEYEVDAAEVDVGTEEVTVEVPDVDVTMPEDDGDADIDIGDGENEVEVEGDGDPNG
jgi:hypothetical protein